MNLENEKVNKNSTVVESAFWLAVSPYIGFILGILGGSAMWLFILLYWILGPIIFLVLTIMGIYAYRKNYNRKLSIIGLILDFIQGIFLIKIFLG